MNERMNSDLGHPIAFFFFFGKILALGPDLFNINNKLSCG